MTVKDQDAMQQVISTYYDDIYKFCYWKVHNRDEAQDITQDTFIRYMDAAQTYADIKKPEALLYTIAGNLCTNWLKRWHPASLEALEPHEEPVSADFSDRAIQSIALANVVSLLPREQQDVLLLRYGQELKVSEIAELLGLSRFQAMYRIRTALKELKKQLKEDRYESSPEK